MNNYLDLGRKILEQGSEKMDRTGTGTIALFGDQLKFDLSEGFPAVTTKKLAFKTMVGELIWFLNMGTTIEELQDYTFPKLPYDERRAKKTIWNDNYDSVSWQKNKFLRAYREETDYKYLGRIYGTNWRSYPNMIDKDSHLYNNSFIHNWGGFDQIRWLLNELTTNPNSRKMITLSFHPEQYKYSALSSCHTMFQVQVMNGKLNLMFNQSSSDYFLGLPFNIASYAVLAHMLAKYAGYEVGQLICALGDVHIYLNHINQVNEMLSREPLSPPKLWLNPEIADIFKYTIDDIKLLDYNSHGAIKAIMAY